MPIYEYACKKCQVEFEALIRGDERPACPRCGGQSLERLLSVPAAHTSSSSAAGPPCGDACSLGSDGYGGCGNGMCGLD